MGPLTEERRQARLLAARIALHFPGYQVAPEGVTGVRQPARRQVGEPQPQPGR